MKLREVFPPADNERGIALVELLVVTLISTAIVGVSATTYFQILTVNNDNISHMTAVKQMENALYWIGRDAQMAQTVQTQGASGFPFTISWVDWENKNNSVTYSIVSVLR
jgi:Tfp pilus assembly protein PilW